MVSREEDMPAVIDGQNSYRTARSWQDDAKLDKVEVVICTGSCTFVGHTYRSHQQRLLDALNKGFVADSSRIGRDFVPLTEAEVFFPDDRSEYLASTYITKANILLVAEKSGEQPQMPDIRDKPKNYLMRTKKPIEAEVCMPLYTLVGKMHGEVWQQLLDTITGDETFLPLTNVEISPELIKGESRFSFVAVNKARIVYVSELPK
jgi:hypothetical protein